VPDVGHADNNKYVDDRVCDSNEDAIHGHLYRDFRSEICLDSNTSPLKRQKFDQNVGIEIEDSGLHTRDTSDTSADISSCSVVHTSKIDLAEDIMDIADNNTCFISSCGKL
jgi:hypothetical protein